MKLLSPMHGAKLSAGAHEFLRKREAPLSGDGKPRVRTPPHDGITLLRAAICLSIVIVHLEPLDATSCPSFLPFRLTKGWLVAHPRLGFESFFILAGYFLAHNFQPVPGQTLSVSGFFRRRTVRLLLPYWLVLIVSWMAWGAREIRHHEASAWFPPGFWKQMLLVNHADIFALVAPQLWFMTPLIQFYLGWGVVFWLVRTLQTGLGSRDVHAATIRIMVAMTAVTFLVSIYMDAFRGGLDYVLMTNAHYLVLGCLVYWYTNTRVGVAWLLCALGMEVAHGCATNQSRPIAAVVTSLLLTCSAGHVYAAGPKLAWPMVVGRCSYSIYLTHMCVGWRVMAVLAVLFGKGTSFWGDDALMWIVAVVGCVLFGYGFYRLVEQPCLKRARNIKYRYPADTLPGRVSSETEGQIKEAGVF